MAIKYIQGDLFGPILADTKPGVIVLPHIVNDKGKFGAGFVVPLGRTFPVVKERYLSWGSNGDNDILPFGGYLPFELGKTQFVNIDDKIFVANMVAQTLGGIRPLYYNHLASCMDDVAAFVMQRNAAREYQARIIAPMFGSKLAGGDWLFIEKLIEDCWLRLGLDVTIYYLPDTLPENWTPPEN